MFWEKSSTSVSKGILFCARILFNRSERESRLAHGGGRGDKLKGIGGQPLAGGDVPRNTALASL